MKCRIRPMGEFGKPWKSILAGCEWCKYNIECFLIAGRNFPQEMRDQEELERDAMVGYGKIEGYIKQGK